MYSFYFCLSFVLFLRIAYMTLLPHSYIYYQIFHLRLVLRLNTRIGFECRDKNQTLITILITVEYRIKTNNTDNEKRIKTKTYGRRSAAGSIFQLCKELVAYSLRHVTITPGWVLGAGDSWRLIHSVACYCFLSGSKTVAKST